MLPLLAKWLARKTPLRKPNRDEGIVSIKPRPKSAHNFLGLLYCFIVLLCICVVSCPYVIYYPTVMARYSLFVLKVPLNPKQTNKQTNYPWRDGQAELACVTQCHSLPGCRLSTVPLLTYSSVVAAMFNHRWIFKKWSGKLLRTCVGDFQSTWRDYPCYIIIIIIIPLLRQNSSTVIHIYGKYISTIHEIWNKPI